MKIGILAFCLCMLSGCVSTPKQTPQERYSSQSTLQLQQRRIQLAREIPEWHIGFGTMGLIAKGEIEAKRKELNEVEMELLRRYENGDSRAALQ